MKRSEARRLLGEELFATVQADGERFFALLAARERSLRDLGKALAVSFEVLESEVGLARSLAVRYVLLRRSAALDGVELERRDAGLEKREVELDAVLFQALLAQRGGRLDCGKDEVPRIGPMIVEVMNDLRVKLGDERAQRLATHMKERLGG